MQHAPAVELGSLVLSHITVFREPDAARFGCCDGAAQRVIWRWLWLVCVAQHAIPVWSAHSCELGSLGAESPQNTRVGTF